MRAPSYTPNQVDVSRPPQARFRAANDGGGVGGALGAGLRDAGQALSQFANAQDQIDERNDRTQARLIDSETLIGFSAVENEFAQLQAGAARKAQTDYSQKLDDLRDKALEQAATPRMRAFVEQSLAQNYARASARIAAHAVQESRVEQVASFDASVANISIAAAGEIDPERRDGLIGEAVGVAYQKLQFEGFTPDDNPEVFQQARIAVTSPIHQQVIDRMLASPDPQIDEIAAYVEAYDDEMTPGLVNGTLAAMKAPLQRRITRSDADLIGLELGEDAVSVGTRPAVDGTVGDAKATFKDQVRVVESGGSDGAKNPRSSATGRYQFIRSTFVSTYNKVYGSGGEAAWSARRNDPDVQEALMDRLTQDNERALQSGGVEATAGNLYLAHFAGAGGALALYRNPDASAESVLGSSVIEANPFLRGKTAGDVITWAASKMGQSGAGYTNSAREWDREKVLGKIEEVAQREGWSPERTERVRDEWVGRMRDDEALLGDQYRDAADEATRIAAQMGDSLISISQLPKSVRDRMDPTDLAEMDRKLEDAAQTRRDAQADALRTSQWNALRIMQRAEPDRFMNLNPLDYIGKISEGNFTTMVRAQEEMRQAGKGPSDFRSGIQKEINLQGKYNDLEIKDDDFPGVFDAMDGYLRGLDRKPTSEDYRKAFEFANQSVPSTRTVFEINTGIRGNGIKIYELDSVPEEWAARYRRRSPTADDAEILRAYRVYRGRAIQ